MPGLLTLFLIGSSTDNVALNPEEQAVYLSPHFVSTRGSRDYVIFTAYLRRLKVAPVKVHLDIVCLKIDRTI